MTSFIYNDTEFSVTAAGSAWDISRTDANGKTALIGTGLFAGVATADAEVRAQALVKSIVPVGVKTVGPDVTHPNMIGDLKIVGPDVTHPNFIYWDRDSTSFPKQL